MFQTFFLVLSLLLPSVSGRKMFGGCIRRKTHESALSTSQDGSSNSQDGSSNSEHSSSNAWDNAPDEFKERYELVDVPQNLLNSRWRIEHLPELPTGRRKADDNYIIYPGGGQGAFAEVKIFSFKGRPQEKLAMKKIIKMEIHHLNSFLREVQALVALGPGTPEYEKSHIIGFKGFATAEYEGKQVINRLIFSASEGGELRPKTFWKPGETPQPQITYNMRKKAFRQMLEATAFMHKKGVAHVDLKMENMVVDQLDMEAETIQIKIIDFGLSRVGHMATQCYAALGTPFYTSPYSLAIFKKNKRIFDRGGNREDYSSCNAFDVDRHALANILHLLFFRRCIYKTPAAWLEGRPKLSKPSSLLFAVGKSDRSAEYKRVMHLINKLLDDGEGSVALSKLIDHQFLTNMN